MKTKSIIPALLFTFIFISPVVSAKGPSGDRSIAVVTSEVATHEISSRSL